MEDEKKSTSGITNYFYGPVNKVINNYGTYNQNAPDNIGVPEKKIPKSAYTDEVIGRAIVALNGEKKPLNEKQLFLAIIKVLWAKCGWSEKWQAACDRINSLPTVKDAELEVKCDYNNLKAPSALKFASLEYKEWETYEPNKNEREVFRKNKKLAELFEEELDKQISLANIEQ